MPELVRQHGAKLGDAQDGHQGNPEQHDPATPNSHDAAPLPDAGIDVLHQIDLFGEGFADRPGDGAQLGKQARMRPRAGGLAGDAEVLEGGQDRQQDDGRPRETEDRDPQVDAVQVGPLQVGDRQQGHGQPDREHVEPDREQNREDGATGQWIPPCVGKTRPSYRPLRGSNQAGVCGRTVRQLSRKPIAPDTRIEPSQSVTGQPIPRVSSTTSR